MPYKNLPYRLRSMIAERLAAESGLTARVIEELSGATPRAATAAEAIAVAKVLDLDPKKILSVQTDEELAEAGYAAPVKAPAEKARTGAKSPARPGAYEPKRSVSTTW